MRKYKGSLKKSYLVTMMLVGIIVIIGCFSYALFSLNVEKKDAISIIALNLYPSIESSEFDDEKQVVVSANDVKKFNVTVENINGIDIRYLLYYFKTDENVKVGYAKQSEDSAPDVNGQVIASYGNDSTRVITVVIKNTSGQDVRVKFGMRVGLRDAKISLPDGCYILEEMSTGIREPLNQLVINKEGGEAAIKAKSAPNFKTNATTEEGMYASKDNFGMSYYFRGVAEDNYVSFAGMLWRIVRINGDGTIRLVLDDAPMAERITAGTYNTQQIYYSNSKLKTSLETWYNQNLKDYESKIVKGNYYCEQARVRGSTGTITNTSMEIYSTYNPQLTCGTDGQGRGNLNASIGLLTYDEVNMAGAYPNNTTYNTSFYLGKLNNPWWTMSPAGMYSSDGDTTYYTWQATNKFFQASNGGQLGLRPVINLKADTLVDDKIGNGSKIRPYLIEMEEGYDTESMLGEFAWHLLEKEGGMEQIEAKGVPNFRENATTDVGMYAYPDRYGTSYYFRGIAEDNYVNFAGMIWRIVRINGDGTIRLVLDDAPIGEGITAGTYNTQQIYYSNSKLKTSLETWYSQNLSSYSNAIAAGDYYCEQARVKYNQATLANTSMEAVSSYIPRLTCETDGNGRGNLNASIGLLTYDEVNLAGAYPNTNTYNTNFYLGNLNNSWWTMSPAGMYSSDGDTTYYTWQATNKFIQASNGGKIGLRPVINLKRNVTVNYSLGDGSKHKPYFITTDGGVAVPSKPTSELAIKVLQNEGGINAIEAKGVPDFKTNATTEEGMYAYPDRFGTSYYFRGVAEDNYVNFAGLLWRIVRINGDGTIRLVLDSVPITSSITAGNYNTQQIYYSNSKLKTSLETWYSQNLSSYSNAIAAGDYYCEQARVKYNQATLANTSMEPPYSYTPKLTCGTDGQGHGIVNASIGLLTYDEVNMAGSYTSSTSYNASFYLGKLSNQWWTMSPAGMYSSDDSTTYYTWAAPNKFIQASNGGQLGLRPVINLKTTVKLDSTSGDGSKSSPYVIAS